MRRVHLQRVYRLAGLMLAILNSARLAQPTVVRLVHYDASSPVGLGKALAIRRPSCHETKFGATLLAKSGLAMAVDAIVATRIRFRPTISLIELRPAAQILV